MSLLGRLDRWAARRFACRWLPLNRERGVVSFCFDDAPRSACIAGKQILEQYFARGTYYICGGLTGGSELGRDCHHIEDLHRLLQDGHEISCHTFGHVNCSRQSPSGLQQQWRENRSFFEKIGTAPKGFAFPFGAYGLLSKIAASNRFQYARITDGGTQIGRADLNALRAQPLYGASVSNEKIVELITTTAEAGGWLIFYTHEIEETPGKWGATPAQLAFALHTAQEHRCRVLSVRDAIKFFGKGT